MKVIDLKGRVAVVTGASRGLGRATALELAGAGAKLALLGRDTEKLAETLALVRATGAEAETYICDVRDEARVKQVAADVQARFGAVHILVNNAGTAIRKNIIDFSFDEWRSLTDTNITGVFQMTRAVTPHMMERKFGKIFSISTSLTTMSSAGLSPYGASKAGLEISRST